MWLLKSLFGGIFNNALEENALGQIVDVWSKIHEVPAAEVSVSVVAMLLLARIV